VAILDGGLKAWHAAHLPLSLDPPVKREGNFSGEPDMKLLIDAEHLPSAWEPDLTLIDARALPRFRGEVEPIDPVAGHIPGAQCAAFTDNLGADGRFCRPSSSSSVLPKSWVGARRSSWWRIAGLG
jgi:thiosulfate/3-mercaptopyruvate sulfurtransferase